MASKKKNDKKKGAAETADDDLRPRLSKHPRAKRQIQQAKGWGGIVGFALVALLSLQAGLPYFDAGVRALIAGIGCYMIAWGIAVAIWRHLAQAEILVAEQRIAAEQATTQ
jgi:protein-S-isoprenylcysteine O-methyltransferase Ste14